MRSACTRSHKPVLVEKKQIEKKKGQDEMDMALYLGHDFAEEYTDLVKDYKE